MRPHIGSGRFRRLAAERGNGTKPIARLPNSVQENEEVLPVNVSTWALPSRTTLGR
jgi:hypothetical protein